jgi:multidrug efflux pump subunit AcrB
VFSNRSPKEITQIADKQIKQVLETVQDVGEVQLMGDRRREIRVLLDPNRLNAYGLTVDQVGQAIARQNTEIPGGSFIAGPSEISMRTMGRLRSVQEFEKIVLAYKDGSVDHARRRRARDRLERRGPQPDPPRWRERISMQIRKQSGSNTVTVVDRVMAARADSDDAAVGHHGQGSPRPVAVHPQVLRGDPASLISAGCLARSSCCSSCATARHQVISAPWPIPISIIGTFAVMRALASRSTT